MSIASPGISPLSAITEPTNFPVAPTSTKSQTAHGESSGETCSETERSAVDTLNKLSLVGITVARIVFYTGIIITALGIILAIVLDKDLPGRLCINVGVTMSAKKILTIILRHIILYPLSSPLTLEFDNIIKLRWYAIALFHEFVTIVYCLLLQLLWYYSIVEKEWNDPLTPNERLPDLFSHPPIYVVYYYALIAALVWSIFELFSTLSVLSISSGYMQGRYCQTIKNQFLKTFIVKQLASDSPFKPDHKVPVAATIRTYYGLSKTVNVSSRYPKNEPPLTNEEAFHALKKRHNDAKTQKYLPLLFDIVMSLKWVHTDTRLDDINVDAIETRETYDTTISELTHFFRENNKLRITKLLEHHSLKEEWMASIDVLNSREDQIVQFATYIYEHVLAQAKIFNPDIKLFDKRVFAWFLVEEGIVNDAYNACRTEGVDFISLVEFQTAFIEVFAGHRNCHQLTRDAAQNLSTLSTFIRVPLHFLSCCVIGAIVGIDVIGIGLALTAFLVSFSFIFSKGITQIVDGLSLIYAACPFDIGDMVIIGTSPKSTVMNVGVYTVQLETTNNEIWLWSTSLIAGQQIQNCTRSSCFWDVFYLWVDVGWTAEMTERLNREFTKYQASDPQTFLPGVSYFTLSNLSGGTGVAGEPLKTQLKCIIGYAWNSSVIRRLNNGRSRAVCEIQHILAKMNVVYTSGFGEVLQATEETRHLKIVRTKEMKEKKEA
ncbi:hypothetical protein TrLO_g1391 [Triparma laevis f. longispina]|uniref:Mechanosensitive ion channel MscS domain-containing protein n=1 Tax=Triparma laevis f. longispina TaxID=1714387 RepID=A0A9W7L0B9_9STRA|nr:hypothetical protein TrLO_g1391 [Triparma laevis f. longispina]